MIPPICFKSFLGKNKGPIIKQKPLSKTWVHIRIDTLKNPLKLWFRVWSKKFTKCLSWVQFREGRKEGTYVKEFQWEMQGKKQGQVDKFFILTFTLNPLHSLFSF